MTRLVLRVINCQKNLVKVVKKRAQKGTTDIKRAKGAKKVKKVRRIEKNIIIR